MDADASVANAARRAMPRRARGVARARREVAIARRAMDDDDDDEYEVVGYGARPTSAAAKAD